MKNRKKKAAIAAGTLLAGVLLSGCVPTTAQEAEKPAPTAERETDVGPGENIPECVYGPPSFFG